MSYKKTVRMKVIISIVCVVVIGVVVLFLGGRWNLYAIPDEYGDTYEDDSIYGKNKDYAGTAIIRGGVEITEVIHEENGKLVVRLGEYGLNDRTIDKLKPNTTGLKIVFGLFKWLYIDEYLNVNGNSGVSEIDLSKLKYSSQDIFLFDLAAGYEAILCDSGGKMTKVMGPLRLVGQREMDYPGGTSEGQGRMEIDILNKRDIKDIYGKGSRPDYAEVIRSYISLWDYNHGACWSVPGAGGTYDRNNVKIYDIKTIKLKKTTLREGVYLMKGACNTLNAPKANDKDLGEAYEYIAPVVNGTEEKLETFKYYGWDKEGVSKKSILKIKDTVNSLMIVGPYTVKIEREKKHKHGDERTFTEYIEIRGEEGRIINILNFWRLNDQEGREGPSDRNDLSSIEISPSLSTEGKKEIQKFYEECVVFKDDEYFKETDKRFTEIGKYRYVVKVSDIAATEQDPAVTAYTEKNFGGEYIKFYRGETCNLKDGKDLVKEIKSMEIGANTRVIFSNKEDGDIYRGVDIENRDKIKFNYGTTKEGDNDEPLLFIIEGPCAIGDLGRYTLTCYESGSTVDTRSIYKNMEAFTVRHQSINKSNYVLSTNQAGRGIFLSGDFDAKDSKNNYVNIGDYYPQSLTINGNYFIKFYDKDNNRIKTMVGPLNNARIELDEEYDRPIDELYNAWIKYEDNKKMAYGEADLGAVDHFDLGNFTKVQDKVKDKIISIYNKFDNMKVRIGRSTQRDQKSRSLENSDGIVLYEHKNYNQNIRPEENVWTFIRVDDEGKMIWDSKKNDKLNISSSTVNDNMEIDYKAIGSIRISGSLLGRYKLELEVRDNEKNIKTIVSGNSIRDLNEFANAKIVRSIKLSKIEEDKEFDVLLDSVKGGVKNEAAGGIKVSTRSRRALKTGDFVENEDDDLYEEVDREVYLIDILKVSKEKNKLGLSCEYLYKYDASEMDEKELVGVKLTRDIGKIEGKNNKLVYKDIDTNVKDIVRDIEVKFNQNEESVSLALKGIGLAWGVNGTVDSKDGEYEASQESNQTKDSRNLIITDHGYLDSKDKVNNKSTVWVKNCKEAMEVPAMLIKERIVTIETVSNDKTISTKKTYLEIGKDIGGLNDEKKETDTKESTKTTENTVNETKVHLYMPAGYYENGKWHTSYILSQLGIQAIKSGNTIRLSV